MALRTILFDLGNVLLNFSHERMCRQVAQLFSASPELVRERILTSGAYLDFDRGRLTEEDLHGRLQSDLNKLSEINDLRRAVGDIFEPNVQMHEFLPRLKAQELRLVLLSNTCVTHINWIRSHFETLSYFDDLVLSYEVGACKPDAKIFQAALNKIQCRPDECFYTDDIQEYVMAGRLHGLHAEVFTSANQFRKDLAALGVML